MLKGMYDWKIKLQPLNIKIKKLLKSVYSCKYQQYA